MTIARASSPLRLFTSSRTILRTKHLATIAAAAAAATTTTTTTNAMPRTGTAKGIITRTSSSVGICNNNSEPEVTRSGLLGEPNAAESNHDNSPGCQLFRVLFRISNFEKYSNFYARNVNFQK